MVDDPTPKEIARCRELETIWVSKMCGPYDIQIGYLFKKHRTAVPKYILAQIEGEAVQ